MTLNIKKSHVHLDIVGGIAGDMFISAMLDMFDDLQPEVLTAVSLVLPKEAGKALLSKGINSGISGLRFSLQAQTQAQKKQKNVHQKIDHQHEHSHVAQEHEKSHEHHHTTFKYLCELLKQSQLTNEVTQVAIDLLTIIAKAEAKIHDKTLDDVHFHELADWDSLMDVVASAVILNILAQHTWSLSKLPLGGGLVKTQHGLIPVPAPATAEILTGFEFYDDGIKGERITPTGAAILRYLFDKNLLKSQPQGHLQSTGYGLGTKVFPGMPNILRALSFDTHSVNNDQKETVVIIEFDIDDMTGEEFALSLDLIRQHQGVIDVVVQTGRGKKNRAVELVRIMSTSEFYQNVIEFCFMQTTTIGLRYRFETRKYLQREHGELEGSAYKKVMRPNNVETIKIEHDSINSLSSLHERRMLKYKVESP